MLADAAGWHEDRIKACAACRSQPCEECPDHRADAAQIAGYAELNIDLVRSKRDLAADDTAVLLAATSKAAASRRVRPGADDQALAAAYDELGCQLASGRPGDTEAAKRARALLAEHHQPMTPGDLRHLVVRYQQRLHELLEVIDA